MGRTHRHRLLNGAKQRSPASQTSVRRTTVLPERKSVATDIGPQPMKPVRMQVVKEAIAWLSVMEGSVDTLMREFFSEWLDARAENREVYLWLLSSWEESRHRGLEG